MYSISICFGPQGTVWNLLFKTSEAAAAKAAILRANRDLAGLVQTIEDDFGQEITVSPKGIHAILVEDLDQSQLGQIERGLHNARSQAKAQQRAMGDPTIRTSAMAQGPAVHSPFPNGRFNG